MLDQSFIYITTDNHGKHDYDDFQDKLRRAANGEDIYSIERDQKDMEAELKQQEEEFYKQMGLDDPEKETDNFSELAHVSAKTYKTVYEEALDVLGKDATNTLIAIHQHDVPFGVKEYIDSKLREAIDEHKATATGKRGNDSKVGGGNVTGGSGQTAAVDSRDDAEKNVRKSTTGRTADLRKVGQGSRAGTLIKAAMYLLKSGSGSIRLRKSQMSLFDPHHVAYTRINQNGTVSQIKAKGAPTQHPALDFNAPLPEPEKPKGPKLVDGNDHTAFITNGGELFAHITGFDLKAWKRQHKELSDKLKDNRTKIDAIYSEHGKEIYALRERLKTENPDIEKFWEHPDMKELYAKQTSDPEKVALEGTLGKLGDKKRAHGKEFDDARKKILDHFSQNTPADYCKEKADRIGQSMTPKQKRSMAEFYAVAGRYATSTLATSERLSEKGRANASREYRKIRLTESSTHDTVWHECAHHIEFSHSDIARAARDFRDSRAKKDSNHRPILKTLNELDKTKRYGADERAIQDKFTDNYTGKVYLNGNTEIISMGMGMMAKMSDFKKAVEKDPEFLHFTIGMLHHLNSKS